MSTEIKAIPVLPEGLREAATRGTLIPFVGAGVSRLAGCPNWLELANNALRFFVDQGHLTHSQLDQIKGLNPRIKLSIASQLQNKHRLLVDYARLLKGSKESPEGRRLYSSLSQLGRVFVTTNYDEWLDKIISVPVPSVEGGSEQHAFPVDRDRAVFYRPEDFTPTNLLGDKDTVIHLHGSVREPSGMILTTRDYIRHYRNEIFGGGSENQVLSFLADLFRTRTVLFVGYSLDELEILEYVLLKSHSKPNEKGPHFILQGFFSHEAELKESLSSYYEECGLQLIPFLRDEKDWNQLVHVLEDFARQAPVSEILKSQKLLDMESLLE